ncbi:DEAD/DEAH box helicase [Rothia sp. ZJ1223]|uniref:Lhr family helicase n=1 Tax=Rothia sp. ZJ1223 TaxID=2811098 RepID=UPI001EF6CB30|nr:DEAD/DEAH box helicase [Rothia sp. ZJ1223]
MVSALDNFSPSTRTWFTGAFSAPTAAQEGAWNAISAGKHALIVAPTGSGKTLAAFLWALDRLYHGGEDARAEETEDARAPVHTGTKVLYISPLKALGVDVERNLRAPLIGIAQTAKQYGQVPPQVSVGVRSGDTPAKERRALIAHPPDILITTPESLYLMLTSKARATLTGVYTVIIDEVHAVAGTKRGAHLAVTLERLDQILETPAQRIGLSATVEPVETVARFLGGTAPVDVVRPPSEKEWDLTVSVPVPDMTVLGGPNAYGEGDNAFTPAPVSSKLEVPRAARNEVERAIARDMAFEASPSFTFDDGVVGEDSLADAVEGSHGVATAPGITLAESLGIVPPSGREDSASVAGTASAEKISMPADVADAVGISTPAAPLAEHKDAFTPISFVIENMEEGEDAADDALTGGTLLESSPALGSAPDTGGYQASIWPHVEERIVDVVEAHQSTIVFTNSRGLAEKLTARLNEIYAARVRDRSSMNEEAHSRGGEPQSVTEILAQALAKDSVRLENPDHDAKLTQKTENRARASAPAENTAAPVLARAHHGSVAKDQREIIENALKSGELKCVVATSSLELGIDMGAVEVVVQVEAPFSVASGLQRVGRAGHQVGEVSRGFLYPKHRGDLLNATVTVRRMLDGAIEPLTIPANPLDILAQQTVAACALGPIDVEAWFEALRNTAPFATLPRSAFEATLDLLTGKYPSDEFAELRPRIIWDRDGGTIEGRKGAQRLAVTSGGTIPDRGLFPVYIVGSEDSKAPKRVGELDEEMVYESRAGDVIALGASSWRIEDISHDRVSVTPAPGVPGKLPFWHGEGGGRPVDLGRALGKFTRELATDLTSKPQDARAKLTATGLDTWAADNLEAYVRAQIEAVGSVPSDIQFTVERFRDEIGDWRLILHSPLGMPVHAPWALAVGQRVEAQYGVNASAMAADDGIVLRIPAMEAEPPGADIFLFDADELEDIVMQGVGSSALFASRFRECAARALLLPRKDPGRRTPLWQQRQRSAQLLDVARKYPSFPIILETVRECMQDVYDLPALIQLHKDIDARTVRLVEVETESPSPFARTLLFGYVAQFLYEGDSPLAERRAAALSLDPALLTELLGRDELRELLDANVIRSTEARLQHTATGYRYRGVEGTADLLRLLGPLTATSLAARLKDEDAPALELPETVGSGEEAEADQPLETTEKTVSVDTTQAFLDELVGSNRALRFNLHGVTHYAAIEDASRLRDGLGVPLPMGVPLAFLEPVKEPLLDLVARYARTHAPFTAAQAGASLGLGVAIVDTALRTLAADRRVLSGDFLPDELHEELTATRAADSPAPPAPISSAATQWVDAQVLRTLRSRSLAILRQDVEPVAPHIYGRFLPPWQHVETWKLTEAQQPPGTFGTPVSGIKSSVTQDQSSMLSGYDGLLTVIDQLAGVRLPASALEPLVLRSRVKDYSPALLDQAMSSGDVLWIGDGELAGSDGWVSLHLSEASSLTLPDEQARITAFNALAPLDKAVYEVLGSGGLFIHQIQAALQGRLGDSATVTLKDISGSLWNLIWAGLITNDTFAPVRALLSGGSTAHKVTTPAPRARSVSMRRGAARLSGSRFGGASRFGSLGETPVAAPIDAGRWSRVYAEELDSTIAAHARSELLMDRYGVLTRGAVALEDVPGGFTSIYRVLSAAEEKGLARRGYFIEGLGAAQFSTANTVDRLRDYDKDSGDDRHTRTVTFLAATDPANPYGAALPWPQAPALDGASTPIAGAESLEETSTATRHKPGRKAGAAVVLVDGELTLYVERGGKTMLIFTEDTDRVKVAAPLIGELVRRGAAEKIMIEKVNGFSVLDTPDPLPAREQGQEAPTEHPVTTLRAGLLASGFYPTPKGLRMRKDY